MFEPFDDTVRTAAEVRQRYRATEDRLRKARDLNASARIKLAAVRAETRALHAEIKRAETERLEAMAALAGEGPITNSLIVRACCQYFRLTQAQLIGPTRSHPILRVRHIAMILCARWARNNSSCAIGRAFNRDHATILHALAKPLSPQQLGDMAEIERRLGLGEPPEIAGEKPAG